MTSMTRIRSAARLHAPARCSRSAPRVGAAADARAPRAPAQLSQLDVTQGNVQPMPIALPDFVGGTPGDGEVARNVTQVITANLQRSGLFAPIDPAAFIEQIANIDARAALPRLARDQRAGAGHRPRHAPGRRPAQGRIPAVGRVRRPAAHRPAVFHRARQLAAHRAHHLGRDLRAADRREGLFRHAASCSSTRPGRRSAASSGSPSWIRTAPTCAISRAATTSC